MVGQAAGDHEHEEGGVMDHETMLRGIGYFLDFLFHMAPAAALAALTWRIAR